MKFSPEFLVDKFIKSASGDRSVSGITRRVITVMIILILTIGLVYTCNLTYEGIIAIPKYKKAKALLELSQKLDHNSFEYHATFGCYRNENFSYDGDLEVDSETLDTALLKYGAKPNKHQKIRNTLKQGTFNPRIWEELGILNPSSLDCGVEYVAYANQSREMGKLLAIPLLLLYTTVLLVGIWLITRLTFWVIDADKSK